MLFDKEEIVNADINTPAANKTMIEANALPFPVSFAQATNDAINKIIKEGPRNSQSSSDSFGDIVSV